MSDKETVRGHSFSVDKTTGDSVREDVTRCAVDESGASAGFEAADPAPQAQTMGSDLTNEQKEITLLRIIDAMGGETDSSESRHSWLNWFCSDEIHNVQDDTFNRCNDKGWLSTAHNSDWDTSTTTLTKAGAALAAQASEASDGK